MSEEPFLERTERLYEQAALDGIDLAAIDEGEIRNVRILGFTSRNGRQYSREALAEAAPLYEGAPVFVDHAPDAARKAEDRFGVLTAVRLAEDGLRGTLKYLTTHPLAKRIREDIVKGLRLFGLSHNADGIVSDGIVKKILKVHSVDLVTGPATTAGLLEQEGAEQPDRLEAIEARLSAIEARMAEMEERLGQLAKLREQLISRPVATPSSSVGPLDRKQLAKLVLGY